MKDANGNILSTGDQVLEVGAPVNEAGTVVRVGKPEFSTSVQVEWTTDAEGDVLDEPVKIWYKATDLIKVWGQDEDGSFITQQ